MRMPLLYAVNQLVPHPSPGVPLRDFRRWRGESPICLIYFICRIFLLGFFVIGDSHLPALSPQLVILIALGPESGLGGELGVRR